MAPFLKKNILQIKDSWFYIYQGNLKEFKKQSASLGLFSCPPFTN